MRQTFIRWGEYRHRFIRGIWKIFACMDVKTQFSCWFFGSEDSTATSSSDRAALDGTEQKDGMLTHK